MGVMVLPPLSVGGPGFNEFVSGPYRLGGNAPVSGTSPTVLPSNSAEAAVREGRGRGSAPSGRAPIPLGRRWSPPPLPRESPLGRGGAGMWQTFRLFTARFQMTLDELFRKACNRLVLPCDRRCSRNGRDRPPTHSLSHS